MSVKRKQVFINEKNTSILQLWDQKLRLSNDRMEVFLLKPSVPHQQSVSILQAYALNEMANIERLRSVQQEITSTVDQITNDFKQRMQSILSDNQLLPSKERRSSESVNAVDLYSFSSGAAYIGSFHSDQRWTTDEQ